MRSRRGFIGGMVGSTALLAGCIGALQNEEESGTGDGGADERRETYVDAVGSIYISPEVTGASVEVHIQLADADRVIFERNGREIETFRSDTEEFQVVVSTASPGDLYKLRAVYPNGTSQVITERCYECDGSGGRSQDGGTSEPDSDPDPAPDTEPNPDPEPDPDPEPEPDPEPTGQQVVDTRRSISEDRYLYWGFELDQQATVSYSYTVHGGPDVDIFIMPLEEFEEFENGNSFRAYGSQSGSSGSESATIPAGTYRFVIDNTEAGAVAPPTNFEDDVADVEIEATVE